MKLHELSSPVFEAEESEVNCIFCRRLLRSMHFVFTRAKLEVKERAEKKRLLEEEEERCIKMLIKICDNTVH